MLQTGRRTPASSGASTPPLPAGAPIVRESSWLDINVSRLDANLEAFRAIVTDGASAAKRPLICAMIKADAYGLGMISIAQRLAARGVDMLGVYCVAHAGQLSRAAVPCPILVFEPLRALLRTDPLYRTAITNRLHVTIHDLPQLEQVNKIGMMYGCRLAVHLHLDTGMSRSGLNSAQFAQALRNLAELRHVCLTGIYTHLATADGDPEFACEQMARLDETVADNQGRIPDGVLVHLANTFAAVRDRRFHRDMVRVGLGLFGYGPDLLDGGPIIGDISPLQPVVRWRSRIVHVQRYPKGGTVGYGRTVELLRDSVLGVVPVGYGDGYPVALSNKAMVTLPELATPAGTGRLAPVRGKVNMDQIAIDLTDCPGAAVGSLVEIISDDPASPCSLPRLAELAGASCYEMLTRLSPRLHRRYIAGGRMD